MLNDKSQQIRQMFSAIAPHYDLLNHLLSANIDRLWRRRAVRHLAPCLSKPAALCLDLCCGTGDLALEIAWQHPARILAFDFSHPMVMRAALKSSNRGLSERIHPVEADALQVPLGDGMADALTIGFGLRNLVNLKSGLLEMRRVLKPGGKLLILEFAKPAHPIFRSSFDFYFNRILPRIGKLISRHHSAYTYLPGSVAGFPSQQELVQLLEETGFVRVRYENLTGGIAAIHRGEKPLVPYDPKNVS